MKDTSIQHKKATKHQDKLRYGKYISLDSRLLFYL